MEKKDSNIFVPFTRTKTPKKRNTDVRKEQNRIASRAYREKRKQKLALLDEILKSDSQTDSMSSVSDEPEGYAGSWSLQSRQASNSPAPATLPLVSPWPVPSPAMSSVIPAYGHDTYEGWMSTFDQQDNAYPTSNEYVHPYIPTETGDNALGTAAAYNLQSIPSMASDPSTPPIQSIPLDPSLSNSFSLHHHHVPPPLFQTHDDDEIQRQSWVASLEEDALVALDKFAGLSHVQQQKALVLIRKRRGLSQNAANYQNFEFGYPSCQATPPPSGRFVSNDFGKYHDVQQASGSPLPSGRR